MLRHPFRAILLALIPLAVVRADGPERPILNLHEALDELHKQTGSTVTDRRSTLANPKLSLPRKLAGFWPTLDTIGKQTGIGFSAYQPDGGVALIDSPYRAVPTFYSAPFRFAVKRLIVSRDDETLAHACTVALDVAWEPRFQALYLNLEEGAVQFKGARGAAGEKLERQTTRGVSGGCATEIDLRLSAPPRATLKLDTLKGTLRVIGAPKMLDFAFAKLAAPATRELEGVKVSLAQVKVAPGNSRWTVDVLVEYPPDAIVPLESFQSWMLNNRVWLEWPDAKTKSVQKLEPIGEAPLSAVKGTKIRFEFTPQPGVPLPANLAAATLHYHTPNRVQAYTVPFEFKDLLLP